MGSTIAALLYFFGRSKLQTWNPNFILFMHGILGHTKILYHTPLVRLDNYRCPTVAPNNHDIEKIRKFRSHRAQTAIIIVGISSD